MRIASPRQRLARTAGPRASAFAMLAVSINFGAGAEERLLPTPLATIYPGEVIRESMIEEKLLQAAKPLDGDLVASKEMTIGRMAKRTLLPQKPIPAAAIDSPRLIRIGAPVKIVFEESGLVIVAYGAALQSGAVGELIRVRNQDSGLVVSGRVQADGSIRVGEG